MKILVVEDHVYLAENLKKILSTRYQVAVAHTLRDAERALDISRFSLILLDLQLPDGNGMNLIQRLRAANNTTPVLVLSGIDGASGKCRTLMLGADDYVTKPFDMIELFSRIEAVLRRCNRHTPELTYGDLTLSFAKKEIKINGIVVHIRRKEFDILYQLLTHKNEPLSAERLISQVWLEEKEPFSNAVNVTIARLRTLLRLHNSTVQITNRRGFGFLLSRTKITHATMDTVS